uniref:30S ribosomal protein S16, chloroplastic n=1 Tax=Allium caeruleum TaxID=138318 RepID=A0A6M8U1M6_9ASPA|nr:ribosomal protein S16 [Allium caeruleum]QKJ80421.1 ribosomal protein S16 [Allium caeruleum]
MVKLRLKRCGRESNERSIKSLQLMFDPDEKEEIFERWVFMIQSKIKLIYTFLLFVISLKKVLNLQELFMIFQEKQNFEKNS